MSNIAKRLLRGGIDGESRDLSLYPPPRNDINGRARCHYEGSMSLRGVNPSLNLFTLAQNTPFAERLEEKQSPFLEITSRNYKQFNRRKS